MASTPTTGRATARRRRRTAGSASARGSSRTERPDAVRDLRKCPGEAGRPRRRQRGRIPGVRREQRQGRGARLRELLRRRAPFHRLRSDLGDLESPDVGRSPHDDVVEPPTAKKPHPPLWMGAGRPASIKKVADLGYRLLLDQFAPIDQIGERIALYKAEVEARGRRFDPMSVGVTRSINVSMTAAERQKALETRMAARRRVHDLAQRPDGQNKSTIMTYANTLEAAEAGALYGTPDEIAVKLQALRDLGAEYVLLNSTGGIETLRRFAKEVMPAFRV